MSDGVNNLNPVTGLEEKEEKSVNDLLKGFGSGKPVETTAQPEFENPPVSEQLKGFGKSIGVDSSFAIDSGLTNLGEYAEGQRIVTPFETDFDNLRALNQSNWEKVRNGLVKGAATFTGAFAENIVGIPMGIGNILYEGVVNQDLSLSNFYNTPLGRAIDSFNQAAQENFPNYKTQQEQVNDSLMESAFGVGAANFWSDTVLNGAAYSAASISSLFATGGMGFFTAGGKAGKALYNTTKNSGKLSKGVDDAIYGLGRNTKVGDITKKLDTAFSGNAFRTAAKELDKALLLAVGESNVEARGTLEESYEKALEREALKLNPNYENLSQAEKNKLLESLSPEARENAKQIARTAANWNHLANMIIVGSTDYIQFGRTISPGFNSTIGRITNAGSPKLQQDGLLKSIKKSILESKPLDRNVVKNAMKLGKFQTDTPGKLRGIWKFAAKDMLLDGLSETAQEGLQFTSNDFLTDYMLAKHYDGGTASFIGSLGDALAKTFTDMEGKEAMLSGFITGVFMSAIRLPSTYKSNKEKLEAHNKAVETILNSDNGIGGTINEEQKKEIKKALKENDILNADGTINEVLVASVMQINNKVDLLNTSAYYNALMEVALEKNDIRLYKDSQAALYTVQFQDIVDNGLQDYYLQRLNEAKELDDENFKKYFNFEENKPLPEGKTKEQIVDKVIENFKKHDTNVRNIRAQFANINVSGLSDNEAKVKLAQNEMLMKNLAFALSVYNDADTRLNSISEKVNTKTGGRLNLNELYFNPFEKKKGKTFRTGDNVPLSTKVTDLESFVSVLSNEVQNYTQEVQTEFFKLIAEGKFKTGNEQVNKKIKELLEEFSKEVDVDLSTSDLIQLLASTDTNKNITDEKQKVINKYSKNLLNGLLKLEELSNLKIAPNELTDVMKDVADFVYLSNKTENAVVLYNELSQKKTKHPSLSDTKLIDDFFNQLKTNKTVEQARILNFKMANSINYPLFQQLIASSDSLKEYFNKADAKKYDEAINKEKVLKELVESNSIELSELPKSVLDLIVMDEGFSSARFSAKITRVVNPNKQKAEFTSITLDEHKRQTEQIKKQIEDLELVQATVEEERRGVKKDSAEYKRYTERIDSIKKQIAIKKESVTKYDKAITEAKEETLFFEFAPLTNNQIVGGIDTIFEATDDNMSPNSVLNTQKSYQFRVNEEGKAEITGIYDNKGKLTKYDNPIVLERVLTAEENSKLKTARVFRFSELATLSSINDKLNELKNKVTNQSESSEIDESTKNELSSTISLLEETSQLITKEINRLSDIVENVNEKQDKVKELPLKKEITEKLNKSLDASKPVTEIKSLKFRDGELNKALPYLFSLQNELLEKFDRLSSTPTSERKFRKDLANEMVQEINASIEQIKGLLAKQKIEDRAVKFEKAYEELVGTMFSKKEKEVNKPTEKNKLPETAKKNTENNADLAKEFESKKPNFDTVNFGKTFMKHYDRTNEGEEIIADREFGKDYPNGTEISRFFKFTENFNTNDSTKRVLTFHYPIPGNNQIFDSQDEAQMKRSFVQPLSASELTNITSQEQANKVLDYILTQPIKGVVGKIESATSGFQAATLDREGDTLFVNPSQLNRENRIASTLYDLTKLKPYFSINEKGGVSFNINDSNREAIIKILEENFSKVGDLSNEKIANIAINYFKFRYNVLSNPSGETQTSIKGKSNGIQNKTKEKIAVSTAFGKEFDYEQEDTVFVDEKGVLKVKVNNNTYYVDNRKLNDNEVETLSVLYKNLQNAKNKEALVIESGKFEEKNLGKETFVFSVTNKENNSKAEIYKELNNLIEKSDDTAALYKNLNPYLTKLGLNEAQTKTLIGKIKKVVFENVAGSDVNMEGLKPREKAKKIRESFGQSKTDFVLNVNYIKRSGKTIISIKRGKDENSLGVLEYVNTVLNNKSYLGQISFDGIKGIKIKFNTADNQSTQTFDLNKEEDMVLFKQHLSERYFNINADLINQNEDFIEVDINSSGGVTTKKYISYREFLFEPSQHKRSVSELPVYTQLPVKDRKNTFTNQKKEVYLTFDYTQFGRVDNPMTTATAEDVQPTPETTNETVEDFLPDDEKTSVVNNNETTTQQTNTTPTGEAVNVKKEDFYDEDDDVPFQTTTKLENARDIIKNKLSLFGIINLC